jgi:transposase InsO family protein
MRSVLLHPSERSVIRSTTLWPNRSWASSRRSSHRNPAALDANGGPWRGLDDLEIATCAWVSWFNEERLHSELGDKTPEEFEAEYRHKSQPDAA